MKCHLLPLLLAASIATASDADAAQKDELRAAYEQFVTAQNARDLASVRELLLDSPQFLWVSDGKTFWGRETMLARMARYQQAEVWRASPDLDKASFVEVTPDSGYVHMPLTLRFGSHADGLYDTHFLVSILFVRTDATWRIAALFTTIQNPS